MNESQDKADRAASQAERDAINHLRSIVPSGSHRRILEQQIRKVAEKARDAGYSAGYDYATEEAERERYG